MGFLQKSKSCLGSLATAAALLIPVKAVSAQSIDSQPAVHYIDRNHGTLSSLVIPSRPSQYDGFLELQGEVVGPRFNKFSAGVAGYVSLANVFPYNRDFISIDIRTNVLGHYQLTPNFSLTAGYGVQSFLAMQPLSVTVEYSAQIKSGNPIVDNFFKNVLKLNVPFDCTCGAADWRHGSVLGFTLEEGSSRLEYEHFHRLGGDGLFGYVADEVEFSTAPRSIPVRVRTHMDRTVPSENQTFDPSMTFYTQIRPDFPGVVSVKNPFSLLNYFFIEFGERSVLEPLPYKVNLDKVSTINNTRVQYFGFGGQLPLGNGHREN